MMHNPTHEVAKTMLLQARQNDSCTTSHRFDNDDEALEVTRSLKSPFTVLKLHSLMNGSWSLTLTILPDDDTAVKLATEWVEAFRLMNTASESESADAAEICRQRCEAYCNHTGIKSSRDAYRAALQTSGLAPTS
jgi:hypothetical protein